MYKFILIELNYEWNDLMLSVKRLWLWYDVSKN